MKKFRLWLLVLLAVLLPIRGAVAVAMVCPTMGSGGPLQQGVGEHLPANAEHRPADVHEPDRRDHHHGHGGQHDHQKSSGTPDECNLCAAFCSVTPMLSSLPTLDLPRQASAVFFPDLAAQPLSFVSGGEDRPPRTR